MIDLLAIVPIQEALISEINWLGQIAEEPGEYLHFWQSNESCLVAPASLANSVHFQAASTAAQRLGWPVHVRSTGGDVSPQGPGIVNVTQVFRASRAIGIDESFDYLCTPIEAVLRRFGHSVTRGPLPDAFCNGRHNIQIDSRKFAGTAQRRKQCKDSSGTVAILNHALLLAQPISEGTFNALNTFRTLLGDTTPLAPLAHTHLSKIDLSQFLISLRSVYLSRNRSSTPSLSPTISQKEIEHV